VLALEFVPGGLVALAGVNAEGGYHLVRVNKRDSANTNAFLADLRCRIVNRPEISSDGFIAYPDAVERAFETDCTFAQIIKQYHGEPAVDTARRYSPGVVVGVERRYVRGMQRTVSTSYVERGNLSVRMSCRRFARLPRLWQWGSPITRGASANWLMPRPLRNWRKRPK